MPLRTCFRYGPAGLAALTLGALTGCTTPADLRLPETPAQAWQADSSAWDLPAQSSTAHTAGESQVFTIPAVPALQTFKPSAIYPSDTALTLPQLIDIAQRENPSTRLAWNRAREAALSIGLTDALFLPSLTASVITGEQRLRIPVKLPLGLGTVDVDNKVSGTTPMLTLTWLLFDFGERDAIREGTQYAALTTNILFNAAHQKVIRDVTDAYYRYNAARTNTQLAHKSLKQHEHVLQAVTARLEGGLATRIDLALAKQALAQGKLNVVTHEGLERSSYLALMQAVGLPPDTQLQVAAPGLQELPASSAPLTQQRIEQVIAQRADIAAAYAAVKIADAGQRAAKAAFMPKVYMGAGLAKNSSTFQAGNLSGLGVQNTGSGVLLGISIPLYDAGLRSTQLSKAELAKEQAQLHLEHLQMTAVREIVAAEQVLQTALQSHEAATELVETASVVHDASLEAYKVGRISTVLLTESAIQLNKANQALAEAQYAAVAAAANLAFVMGTMVSADASWLPTANSTSLPETPTATMLPALPSRSQP